MSGVKAAAGMFLRTVKAYNVKVPLDIVWHVTGIDIDEEQHPKRVADWYNCFQVVSAHSILEMSKEVAFTGEGVDWDGMMAKTQRLKNPVSCMYMCVVL